MKPSELTTLLSATIPAHLPTLLTGAPGIGKTELVQAAAKTAKAELVLTHPAVEDPTDSKGLPFKLNDTEAGFLPFGTLKHLMDTTKPTVWFVDDFGQAAESVQKAYMQWLLGGELAGKRLSKHVTMIVATNRRGDKAGVSGILEPVKSRFATIVELQADVQEWCNWAITTGVSPTLLAHIRFRPDRLSDFKPTADLTNSPSPRTWFNLSRIEALKLPKHIEAIAMAGAVGEGDANEYLAFRSMVAHMVSVDAILVDPAGTPLPTKASERFAVCTGLAARANDKTIARIGVYANRLAAADAGEAAALIIRDSIRRCPAIANTADYVTLMCGPLGALVSGQTID